jgi:hypothetical protein
MLPPMALLVHVRLGVCKLGERCIATLAFVDRTIVALLVLVLQEIVMLVVPNLAMVAVPDMVLTVHVLFRSTPAAEALAAFAAVEYWTIVALVFLMVLKILAVIECLVTVRTFPDVADGILVLPHSWHTAELLVAFIALIHLTGECFVS